jgi:hypothetical protein
MTAATAYAIGRYRAWRAAERAAKHAEQNWLKAATNVPHEERGDYDAAINKLIAEEDAKDKS